MVRWWVFFWIFGWGTFVPAHPLISRPYWDDNNLGLNLRRGHTHPSEASVLVAEAGTGFSQLFLSTALAQVGKGHIFPQDGVGSFFLPTGEVEGHLEPKGPGGDELSAPHLHGVVNLVSTCGEITLGLELAHLMLWNKLMKRVVQRKGL